MTLFKTSVLNGIAVAIKMATLLLLNKVLALYVGPSGYAIIGQFQNSIQMVSVFAGGISGSGVVKYTAEYSNEPEKRIAIWRTSAMLSLASSVLIGIVVACFSRTLALWFLGSVEYYLLYTFFGAFLPLFVLNTLLLSILNGTKELGKFVLANIAGSLISLFMTSLLVVKYDLFGALLSVAIYQSIAFFATFAIFTRTRWSEWRYFWGHIDSSNTIKLAKFALMTLVSAACIPLSHIAIRSHLGTSFDWEAAGLWEAMWRLSIAYLTLITTTLSVYFLPKLSELSDAVCLRREILRGYCLILPVTCVLSATIYTFRSELIVVLFSEDFLGMQELFFWQLLGDTLKVGGWILAFLMLSKALTTMYIVTEIVFSFSFYMFAVVFTHEFGLKGVTMAYALNYALYWLTVGMLINWRLNLRLLARY